MQGHLSTAVLGYGSLMNNLQSINYHTHERYGSTLHVHLDNDSNFSTLEKVGAEGKKVFRIDPSLTLPVALKGKAGGDTENRRFTRVIDPSQGIPGRPIAYAISDFDSLTQTIQDVAAREGTTANSQFICHLTRDQNSNGGTTIHSSSGKTYKGNIGVLTQTQAKKVANWADKHGFGSVVWASFAVKTTASQRTQELGTNSILLNNTKQYIRDVPSSIRSDAENAILRM